MRTLLHTLWRFRAFFIASVKREVKSRYVNSGMGAVWLFLNPVLQLLIYYFVFEKIFQIKFNSLAGQDFIAFVAVGLWPWVAFSEGLLSGTNAIDKHQSLLKKMQVPRALLVLIEVCVPFLIHFLGFVFILVVLLLFGQSLALWWLPLLLAVYGLQLLFCFALSLALSAVQVFLKDVAQVLTPVMMVWFYLTPIIYPASLLPDAAKGLLAANPMAAFISAYRDLLLDNHWVNWSTWAIMLCTVALALLGGYALFRRLSARFEDMF
ncbi:MAG: phosphate ABC transporter permease [Gammaproteobacteria bacterium]|nr:MAG: phosphate ABC transporter permease [Gammaproteobacteria bacterium]